KESLEHLHAPGAPKIRIKRLFQRLRRAARRRAGAASGFSLLELLIVVAIIGVLVGFALLQRKPVIDGFNEKVVTGKLNEVAEIERQFRITTARGRFGTLSELRAVQTGTGPLMNPDRKSTRLNSSH